MKARRGLAIGNAVDHRNAIPRNPLLGRQRFGKKGKLVRHRIAQNAPRFGRIEFDDGRDDRPHLGLHGDKAFEIVPRKELVARRKKDGKAADNHKNERNRPPVKGHGFRADRGDGFQRQPIVSGHFLARQLGEKRRPETGVCRADGLGRRRPLARLCHEQPIQARVVLVRKKIDDPKLHITDPPQKVGQHIVARIAPDEPAKAGDKSQHQNKGNGGFALIICTHKRLRPSYKNKHQRGLF